MTKTEQTKLIRDIIADNRVTLVFHPVLSVKRRGIVGVEALPEAVTDGGRISYAALHAMAMAKGLTVDLDRFLRQKALEGLEPYVAEDVRVRNAVLEALLNDSDPRIRTASINILEPVEADTSVRQVLYSVSTSDESPQIRNVSRQVLSRVPEIQ